MKHIFTRSLIAFLAVTLLSGGSLLAHAEDPAPATSTAPAVNPVKDEVESMIKAKAAELERVNRELEAAQHNLQSTQSERASLQRKVNDLTKNISRLELSIKSDEITSQKLALEIDSINYDIHDIELSVQDKRAAIARILRQLQQSENENALIAFLRSPSLADGFWEAQSLMSLKNQLVADIGSLFNLQKDLGNKASAVSSKKSEIQFRQKNAVLKKSIIEDQKDEQKVVLAQTKSKETLFAQQLSDLEKQQDAIQDELAKLEDKLKANFNNGLLPAGRHGILDWPIKLTRDGGPGRLTQHYGEKSSLYRGKPHNGLDIGVPIGTPVYAAADGVVMAADNNDRSKWNKYQYGRYVLIKHPNNLATIYAHLSQQTVSTGVQVKRGDLIGYSGNTGYSTGPHLHFGAYWAPSIQLKSIPPAAGLVPVGVTTAPEDYL
jgi:murein DD-endopeptidase MepM/ murein hydrolase activator NlpD